MASSPNLVVSGHLCDEGEGEEGSNTGKARRGLGRGEEIINSPTNWLLFICCIYVWFVGSPETESICSIKKESGVSQI